MTEYPDDSDSLQPLAAETFAQYALRDPREILQWLNTLQKRRVPLTAFIGAAPRFITEIVDLTPGSDGSLVIDASADETVNEEVRRATEIVCVTRLDNVKLQFGLHKPVRIDHGGRPALRAPLPDAMLRLQRREYFRLSTPDTDPVTCQIAHTLPDGSLATISVRILDISGGGLAVVVPPEEIAFAPGDEFDQCSLELPDGEPVAVKLKVRNRFHVEKANGIQVLRAGCEFIGLSGRVTARIQRYIYRLEQDLRT